MSSTDDFVEKNGAPLAPNKTLHNFVVFNSTLPSVFKLLDFESGAREMQRVDYSPDRICFCSADVRSPHDKPVIQLQV